MSERQQGQGTLPVIFLNVPDLDVLADHYLAFLDCGGVAFRACLNTCLASRWS